MSLFDAFSAVLGIHLIAVFAVTATEVPEVVIAHLQEDAAAIQSIDLAWEEIPSSTLSPRRLAEILGSQKFAEESLIARQFRYSAGRGRVYYFSNGKSGGPAIEASVIESVVRNRTGDASTAWIADLLKLRTRPGGGDAPLLDFSGIIDIGLRAFTRVNDLPRPASPILLALIEEGGQVRSVEEIPGIASKSLRIVIDAENGTYTFVLDPGWGYLPRVLNIQWNNGIREVINIRQASLFKGQTWLPALVTHQRYITRSAGDQGGLLDDKPFLTSDLRVSSAVSSPAPESVFNFRIMPGTLVADSATSRAAMFPGNEAIYEMPADGQSLDDAMLKGLQWKNKELTKDRYAKYWIVTNIVLIVASISAASVYAFRRSRR